jgi:hypothetical protein
MSKDAAHRLVAEVKREAAQLDREHDLAQVARRLLQEALRCADELLARKT